jgi:hypothetical protein
MTAGDAAPERAPLANEVLLADELVEASGTHPRREWLLLGRRLEHRLRSSAGQSGRGAPGGHGPMVRGHGPGGCRRPAAPGSDRVGDVHQDVDDREDPQQPPADDGDPPDIAPDVGVLLGSAGRE